MNLETKNLSDHFWISFVIFALCYGVINFLFLSHNHLISYPVQQDDYGALSTTFSSLSWKMARPVFYFFSALFAEFGREGYFLIVPGLLILYATLVFRFVQKFFSSSLPIEWGILYAVLLFSSPEIIDSSKFLGFAINLCSTSLGLISMLALLKGYRENKNLFFILASLFFTLTLFTKEDFILPNILLVFFIYFFEKEEKVTQNNRKIKLLIHLGYSIIAIIALILFNKYIVHSAFTGMNAVHSADYEVNTTFSSLCYVATHYLTISSYATALSIIQLLIFALSLLFTISRVKIKNTFMILIVLSLILPYAVLPNHIFAYYSYNWIPWQTAAIVFGLFFLLPTSLQKSKKINSLFLCIIAIASMKTSYNHRHGVAAFYANTSEVNKNILSTLLHYKTELNKETTVGIAGVKGLTPWSNTSGNYVHDNLGVKPKWIVFVDKSTIFFKINANDQINSDKLINVLSITKICDFPHMKYLYFAPDGKGKLTDNCRNIR